jgi:hypothetical protein
MQISKLLIKEHPNIIKYLGHVIDAEKNMLILTEYYEGNLKNKIIDEKTLIWYIEQILESVEELCNLKILHDLKP